MEYRTYPPHPDLAPLIDCYWTLEVPAAPDPVKQRIIPDGLIELAFILGDDIKRYTTQSEYILQPRAMVLGQTMAPFYIEPVGAVNTFAIRFYPYGFAAFTNVPIKDLADRETPLALLFGDRVAAELEQKIAAAENVEQRIAIMEDFLLARLTAPAAIDQLVKSTVDAIYASGGGAAIKSILKDSPAERRRLERKFVKLIGISPKQLGKVIRLQAALKQMLGEQAASLTRIAHESEYYDQAHFIKDFKEFTGVNPGDFLDNEHMRLSALFYK